MDDAEAEAVLVVLGPQIEWTEYQPGRWQGEIDGVTYEVFTGDTGRTIASCNRSWRNSSVIYQEPDIYYRDKETGRIVCGTPSSLKAACERHHATGKWD